MNNEQEQNQSEKQPLTLETAVAELDDPAQMEAWYHDYADYLKNNYEMRLKEGTVTNEEKSQWEKWPTGEEMAQQQILNCAGNCNSEILDRWTAVLRKNE